MNARSQHRPPDTAMPRIVTYWKDEPFDRYFLSSPYLEAHPFFEMYDALFLKNHTLPPGPITFRYDASKAVDGAVLSAMLEGLLTEVTAKKKNYTNFDIVRDRNFNRRRRSGLLIVKCRKYPFVAKLFMETPDMFVKPHSKGFEPMFFYFMGGGVNRHLSGFTRIKNAENIKKTLAASPYWSTRVDAPRKWFWMPSTPRWITIVGKNIGVHNDISIDIPATYCIVADAIDIERRMTLVRSEDRSESLALCNAVKFTIDPHIDNFMIERATHKIIVIDTEHFPTMVGFKKDVGHYTSQIAWYRDLIFKCADDMFFRNKCRWRGG